MHVRGVVVFAMSCALGLGAARAQPDGPTGTVQSPLVAGTVVPLQTQSDLRLLALGSPTASCSASMLNASWAITAAHCVYPLNNKSAATLPYAASQITLTAAWLATPQAVTALQLIVYDKFPYTVNDVALLQVPQGSLDNPTLSGATLWDGKVKTSDPLRAYGRGINALAFQSANGPKQSLADGQYRTATFSTASVTDSGAFYSYPGVNGASIAGGDSGGPSYLPVWDNPDSPTRKLIPKLVGVHSSCQLTCLTGQACTVPPDKSPWQWAASVGTCTDAGVYPLLARISAAIAAPGVVASPGSFGNTVPASVLAHKRALFAVNINEPLLAPSGPAQGTQLTFKNCHTPLVLVGNACQLDASMEIWSYDPVKQRLIHTPSGNCAVVSGTGHTAGAAVVLMPCVGTPQEMWTLISPALSTTWVLRNDVSLQCMNAVPGKSAGGGRGLSQTLATPGTLTQMPCNGSTAQQFASADADYARRTGPR